MLGSQLTSICNFLASAPSPFSSCLYVLAATQAGAESSSSLRVQMVNPTQVHSQHCGMCKSLGGGGHRTTASESERQTQDSSPGPYFPIEPISFGDRRMILPLEHPSRRPLLSLDRGPACTFPSSMRRLPSAGGKTSLWKPRLRRSRAGKQISGEIRNVLAVLCTPSVLKMF